MEDLALPALEHPVLLFAFEGWNDAAESASSALDHLADVWQAETLYELDPEDFYDFQVNRPHLSTNGEGGRTIEWPETTLSVARIPLAQRDVILVRGIEPNMRWRTFTAQIVEMCMQLNVELVLGVGALLSDNAHSRPFPVFTTTMSSDFPDELDFSPSEYEGPTGILGVLQEAFATAGIPSGSLWVQVPHYVAAQPCPKATLALLSRIEEVLDIAVELADLTEEAAAWEKDIDAMAADDDELAGYVKQLEDESEDDAEDAVAGIADEFERYLRRRNTSG